MERSDQRPVRRVGTFTTGVTLIGAGLAMLATLWLPWEDFLWAMGLSPLLLVSLGVETLLAARKDGRVRYDWVGMLLCVLVTLAALCFTAAAWWLRHAPEGWCL